MRNNRKRLLRIGLGLLLLAGVLVLAQGCMYPSASAEGTATQALPRTVTVVGEGSVKIKPDMAQTTIGVETMGETVKEATSEAATTMDAVIAALMAQGVAEKDLQTSGYSVWVDRGSGPELRGADVGTSYRVNNNVTVVVRDLDAVSAVLDAAIASGANTIYGVQFSIAEPEALESQAREKAVADAKGRAQELARLNNVVVGPVLSISELVGAGGGYYNTNFREAATMLSGYGGGAGPVSPGELELTLRLQVVYGIQ